MPETQGARDGFESELRARLHAWFDYFEDSRKMNRRSALAIAASRDSARLGELLTRYMDRISALGFAEVAAWPGDARIALFGELESWQRFVVLAGKLDDGLSRVPLPRTG